MQNVIYKSDFFQNFAKNDLKEGPVKVTRRNLQKFPIKNLVQSTINTGSHSYAQKERKPLNPVFMQGYLSFQKSYPEKAQKVTRESIESYHYITKYKFPQIYINTAFAPMVLMLKAAAPCIKNARHCRQ